jgi:hypothetical protein
MRFARESGASVDRGIVLLAPPGYRSPLNHIVEDPLRHVSLLADAQRLRGRIYLEDGAIQPEQLKSDGRHVQAADAFSWHLLVVDQQERVKACIRYFAHSPGVSFGELNVRQAIQSQPPRFREDVREAIEANIAVASRRGVDYVEMGAWAISEEVRCTSEALRLVLSAFAFADLCGGALGLSCATARHHSSSILKRLGGMPLTTRGREIQPYYDANYSCEMQLLSFDSDLPNPRYADAIQDCAKALLQVPVISPVGSLEALRAKLANQPASHVMQPGPVLQYS